MVVVFDVPTITMNVWWKKKLKVQTAHVHTEGRDVKCVLIHRWFYVRVWVIWSWSSARSRVVSAGLLLSGSTISWRIVSVVSSLHHRYTSSVTVIITTHVHVSTTTSSVVVTSSPVSTSISPAPLLLFLDVDSDALHLVWLQKQQQINKWLDLI